jgi:hypothetical protein
MFVYEAIQYQSADFGVGQLKQTDIINATTGELTPDAAKAAVLWFMNASPQFTGSMRVVNGQWVNEPAMDPAADAYSYLASGQPGAGTVLQQIQTRTAGWIVLVDAAGLANKIEGAPVDLAYVFAKDVNTAKSLIAATNQGGQSFAILPDSAVGATASAGGEKKAEFSIVTPLVGAGIGFLVGGPGGALVGAGIGAGVEYVRTHQKTA